MEMTEWCRHLRGDGPDYRELQGVGLMAKKVDTTMRDMVREYAAWYCKLQRVYRKLATKTIDTPAYPRTYAALRAVRTTMVQLYRRGLDAYGVRWQQAVGDYLDSIASGYINHHVGG